MADLSDAASPIAREIYRRMSEMGTNPTALASRIGAGPTYFRDLFEGRAQRPGAKFLPLIAEALDCSILDLLHPGRAQIDPSQGGGLNEPDEIALLGFWRLLSRAGRRRVMEALIREATDGRSTQRSVRLTGPSRLPITRPREEENE